MFTLVIASFDSNETPCRLENSAQSTEKHFEVVIAKAISSYLASSQDTNSEKGIYDDRQPSQERSEERTRNLLYIFPFYFSHFHQIRLSEQEKINVFDFFFVGRPIKTTDKSIERLSNIVRNTNIVAAVVAASSVTFTLMIKRMSMLLFAQINNVFDYLNATQAMAKWHNFILSHSLLSVAIISLPRYNN